MQSCLSTLLFTRLLACSLGGGWRRVERRGGRCAARAEQRAWSDLPVELSAHPLASFQAHLRGSAHESRSSPAYRRSDVDPLNGGSPTRMTSRDPSILHALSV